MARPIGGVVFGHFGDRVGRKKMLVASLLMMGLGTFAIGLLPTYASIGLAAPLLLVFCRLLQGFAVGGEWGGAVLMVSEHGSDGWRGFWASWPQAGVAMGNLLATGVLWILAAVQSDAAFLDWGWRIPFLLSAPCWSPSACGSASPSRSRRSSRRPPSRWRSRTVALPILEVIKEYPREVFVAMGMRMAENISYYIFTVISITYATTYIAVDKPVILRALLIGAAIQFAIVPTFGALSDKVGRRPLYLAGAVGVAVWTFVFFDLLDTKEPSKILLGVVVGLILHSLMYAPQAAFFSELFGTSVRYTGASVGYQLASIFAGALAPIIALKLLGDVDGRQHHRGRRSTWPSPRCSPSSRCCSPRRPAPPRSATTASSRPTRRSSTRDNADPSLVHLTQRRPVVC